MGAFSITSISVMESLVSPGCREISQRKSWGQGGELGPAGETVSGKGELANVFRMTFNPDSDNVLETLQCGSTRI